MLSTAKLVYLSLICFIVIHCNALPLANVISVKCTKNHLTVNDRFKPTGVHMIAAQSFTESLPAQNKRRQQLISVVLGLSYLGTMVSVMTLPCALSHVDSSLFRGNGNSGAKAIGLDLSRVIFLATLGTAGGKFLLGPPTDKLGGHAVMKLALAINAVLLYFISITTQQLHFAVMWIIVSFVYGATWGAVGAVVRQEFSSADWGSQLGLVASASRVGSMGSSLVFGSIMQYFSKAMGQNSWRIVFRSAAALQALILSIYMLIRFRMRSEGDTAIKEAHISAPVIKSESNEIQETALQLIKRVSKDSKFWGMILAKMFLLGVGQFIGFIPLYLITGLRMEPGAASSASGLFAVGSLISSLIGTRIYKTLQKSTQINTIVAFNAIGTLLPIILYLNSAGIIPTMPLNAVLTILTVWGGCWALPFYVPIGVIALQIGGKQHAALVTNLADGAGFSLAAVFSIYAMMYGRRGEWGSILIALSSFAFISLFSLRHAMQDDVPTHPC